MAITFGRIFHSLQSIFVPVATVTGFGLLLTWVLILYQPIEGPGEQQRMGWQAWDTVNDGMSISNTEAGAGDSAGVPAGVDWWNVSTDTEPDVLSLPLDKWTPLLPHVTGLTEITIAKCVLPPSLDSLCYPKSTPEADALKGKWVRVERDINRETGYWSLFLYYRRSRRLDVDLVDEIVLLPKDEEPTTQGDWRKVDVSLRDGVPKAPPLFLWYKMGPRMAYLSADEKSNLITEIDVLFGDDRPWYGFERISPPTTEAVEGRYESAWLTLRRGSKVAPRAPPLHFSRDGQFKIMQVADLHYSVSAGVCRDTVLDPCTHSDNLTNSLLAHVLDDEKPDMVVFTGDQLNGQGTSWDPRSVLAKFANAVTDRQIPWAAIFGNHDSETGLGREDQMALLQGMPYSLTQRGPKDIHGVGNYVLKVYSADPSKTQLLTLYFLDSGSYSKGVFDWFGYFHPTEYDWIRQDQVNWFLQESSKMPAIERPFTPDGASDFGDIWERQAVGQVAPTSKKLAKPNAMMFFHIPLQESYGAADIDPKTGLPLDIGIHDLEGKGSANSSDGFFDKGIMQAFESDHAAAGTLKEVKVIGNGHCHITENCRRVRGVWLCFGGGGSYSGYSRLGFDRRFRIFDISDYGETIRTYKRTEKDEILDEMYLVGSLAPGPYEGTR